jgi:hypothetical protein
MAALNTHRRTVAIIAFLLLRQNAGAKQAAEKLLFVV